MESTYKISDAMFRSDDHKQYSFTAPTTLVIAESGRVHLSSKYNPPWSGRLALMITMALLCLGAIVYHPRWIVGVTTEGAPPGAQEVSDRITDIRGKTASLMNLGVLLTGPAFLLAWMVTRTMRRKKVDINLQTSDSVLFDSTKCRIAFHSKFDGRPGWVGLEFATPIDYKAASERSKTVMGATCVDGEVPGIGILKALAGCIIILLTVVLTLGFGLVSIAAIDHLLSL
jgi:hypothetical protein